MNITDIQQANDRKRDAARTYLQGRGIDRANANCRHRYEQCDHRQPTPRIDESPSGIQTRHFKE